jgi:hypothetical protein
MGTDAVCLPTSANAEGNHRLTQMHTDKVGQASWSQHSYNPPTVAGAELKPGLLKSFFMGVFLSESVVEMLGFGSG